MRVMNPMNFNQTALERGFEIARSGNCGTVEEIRRQLIREGFNQFQIRGPVLMRQLANVARRARVSVPETPQRPKTAVLRRTQRDFRHTPAHERGTAMPAKDFPMNQDHDHDATHVFLISNPTQFREALARLRFLEGSATGSSLAQERDALELAVSRYLAFSEELKDQAPPSH